MKLCRLLGIKARTVAHPAIYINALSQIGTSLCIASFPCDLAIMVLKSQLLLVLSSPVVSAVTTSTAWNCAASALPTLTVYGASVLTVDAFESTLYSTDIGFRNVTLTYTHPGQNDLITVWLGFPSIWNGRFQGVGGGGWATEFPFEMAPVISQGYAAVSADGGHDALGQTADSPGTFEP